MSAELDNMECAMVEKDGEKTSVADKLVLIGLRGAQLFHTSDGVGYAAVTLDNGGTALYQIESKQMRTYIGARYYRETRKAPSGEAIKNAITTIEYAAGADGEEISLSNRVAWDGEDIVYDLSNEKHESVMVTPDGWKVVQDTTPRFRQFAHQNAQNTPVHGGDVGKLFDIVNVDEEDKLMTMVHMVSSLVPGIAHPILSICGEQGTAKSTASKVFKMLIDPSEIETATMPVNEDRMHQMLSKHHYILFDNVSWIQEWQSDTFCRAATGQSTAVRKLYTDDDDHIFKYKMCVGFNGITYLATRSDLLDRSICLHLLPIIDSERRTEEYINELFYNSRGDILGGLLDALSKAMKIYPTVDLKELPRMADFAKWGCAISEGLGYTQEEFLKAYYRQIEDSNMNAIEANPVAGIVLEFMEDKEYWMGYAGELHAALTELAGGENSHREWHKGMKNPATLGRTLERIAPNLRKIGISWTKLGRRNKGQVHELTKTKTTTPMDGMKGVGRDESVGPTPYLEGMKKIGGRGGASNRGASPTLSSLPTPLWDDPESESKIVHAVTKAIAVSKKQNVDAAEIASAYPKGISASTIEAMLVERGNALGIKKTDNGWSLR